MIACTYIARFGKQHGIDEKTISEAFGLRNERSVRAKVRNIVAMLKEEGYSVGFSSGLSGKPPGERGRRTHWNIVEGLVGLNEPTFRDVVKEIIGRRRRETAFQVERLGICADCG